MSVGIVEPKILTLDLPEEGFTTELGGRLKKIDVCYESCGAPKRDDNVIFICHALTGDAHVAGVRPGETKPSGWWEEMIGEGRAIDTRKWHIICANVLGGCSGTTGPQSINPETQKPYGGSFPQFSISDAVDVFRLFLKQLGVNKLAALIGGSFGGLLVLDWITRCPDEMERACLIATSSSLNTQALAFDIVARASITDDPAWHNGDYYEKQESPDFGLASARQLAHITYLSRDLLQEKFGRRLQENFVNAPEDARAKREATFKTYFQIESYLDYQAMKFLKRFDANTYLHVTRAMDLFDAGAKYGSLEAACARVKAKCLVVSYENDILFTEEQSKEITAALLVNRKDVSYAHLEAGTGHDSFLTDIEDLSPIVSGFLSPREQKVMKWQERLYRNFIKLVPKGARVMDIGCGDGSLLNVLRKTNKLTKSHGVEIDIDKFKEAIADGNNVFWGDADEGVSVAPDLSYDVTIISDTLQEVKNPRGLLKEALRMAEETIVSFPNFANYRIRWSLGFKGRLPVSKALPYQWYDTPNIHCITLKDFNALCKAEGIIIREIKCECRHLFGKLLLALGFKNLGATRIIAKIARA